MFPFRQENDDGRMAAEAATWGRAGVPETLAGRLRGRAAGGSDTAHADVRNSFAPLGRCLFVFVSQAQQAVMDWFVTHNNFFPEGSVLCDLILRLRA